MFKWKYIFAFLHQYLLTLIVLGGGGKIGHATQNKKNIYFDY